MKTSKKTSSLNTLTLGMISLIASLFLCGCGDGALRTENITTVKNGVINLLSTGSYGPNEKEIAAVIKGYYDSRVRYFIEEESGANVQALRLSAVSVVMRGEYQEVQRHHSIPAGTALYPVVFRARFNIKTASSSNTAPKARIALVKEKGMPFEAFFYQDSYGKWEMINTGSFGIKNSSVFVEEERNFSQELKITQ